MVGKFLPWQTRNRSVLGFRSSRSGQPIGRQRGAVLLEVTLVLILFFMLTIGLVDAALGTMAYNTLSHLAREGARYASVRGGTCTSPCVPATANDIRDYVRSKAVGLDPQKVIVTTKTMDLPNGTCVCTCPCSCCWPTAPSSGDPNIQPGRAVQVQVQYNFTPLTHLFSAATITIKSTAQLVISQ